MKKIVEKIKLNQIVLVLFCFLAITLTSCDTDDDGGDVVEPAEISYVSLYHASPNAPGIDILFDNRKVNFNPLRYSNFTSYLNFYAGERNMRIRPANASNVILDTTLNFMQDEAYSLFYVNRLANIQALLVKDSLVAPAVGQAAVRFIHLSPDAPAVGVTRVDETGTPLFNNISYMQATPFMMVESGIQSFEISTTGSTTPALSLPEVNLLSGGIYTIVAQGFVTPPAGNDNNLTAQIILNN